MTRIIDMQVSGFLDALASGDPTPGGGSASAFAAATAAALVSMACNLTVGREKFAAVEEELRGVLAESEALRAELTAAIDEDVVAYDAVSSAYKMPKSSEAEKRERAQEIQRALRGATDVPLRVAVAASRVIELGRVAKEKSNPNVASDAAVAITLARAGMDGAIANVVINLGSISDKFYVEQTEDKLDQLRGYPASEV